MKIDFNYKRFGRLFFKYTTEHYKGYLMAFAVLVGVLILGGSFMVYMAEIPIDRNLQRAFFMMILLMAGTIFTSTVFADLGDKKKAIAWLTLPASHLEKYLVAWVYSYLVFLIVYTITFYLAVIFAVNLKHFPNQSTSLLNVFDVHMLETYLLYAFLHSIAICGAVYFEKMHFIKTAFLFFICIAILIFINKLILGGLLGRSVEATPPFGNIRFSESGEMKDIYIGQDLRNTIVTYLVTALALIFWLASYYRVKEKQV